MVAGETWPPCLFREESRVRNKAPCLRHRTGTHHRSCRSYVRVMAHPSILGYSSPSNLTARSAGWVAPITPPEQRVGFESGANIQIARRLPKHRHTLGAT